MERYKNFSGHSNVVEYESKPESIVVKFKNEADDGATTYEYTDESAGVENVLRMKELAEIGEGLNDFIVQHVKRDYARKW